MEALQIPLQAMVNSILVSGKNHVASFSLILPCSGKYLYITG